MKLTNILVYGEDHKFRPGSIEIEGEQIENIDYTCEAQAADGEMLYAIPGLVDIHFHGCMGEDLSDAKPDTIRIMAEYQAEQGVTSICPASMTLPADELRKIMDNVKAYDGQTGANFVGVNMEGPFVSSGKKGAQAEQNIIPCDIELFRELQERSGNMIRLVDIAPEEPGAMEFIEAVKDEVNVSLAHTLADYDTSVEAFAKGANHVTHLYNAMPPFHHRKPGVIGAAADNGVYVELICDGTHIHPGVVRSTYKMFGSDKICMISDSMRAAGLGPGEYLLGGQTVFVREGDHVARLEDGNIAAAISNLMDCMRIAVKEMQIPLEDAVQSASETPARSIGIFDKCGSLSIGKQADIVLLDKDLNVRKVIVKGRIVKE